MRIFALTSSPPSWVPQATAVRPLSAIRATRLTVSSERPDHARSAAEPDASALTFSSA